MLKKYEVEFEDKSTIILDPDSLLKSELCESFDLSDMKMLSYKYPISIADMMRLAEITRDEILEWVEKKRIPKKIYQELAKPNEPLPSRLYTHPITEYDSWLQFHYRFLLDDDVKAYKSGRITLAELVANHSLHLDWRSKSPEPTLIQWVLTQNYAKDYVDALKGERDPNTGAPSKFLALVKPSAVEPQKVITKAGDKEEGKVTLLDKKGAELLASYDIKSKSFFISPGQVGSSSKDKWAYLSCIWLGKVQHGVNRRDLHEYFVKPTITGNNAELFNGRYIVRCFKTETGKRWWSFKAVNDFKPMDSIYHATIGHLYPIEADLVKDFGHERYVEESQKLFRSKLK